jgi:RND family efflux transporter MFP subunit
MTQANPDVQEGKKGRRLPWILGIGLVLAVAAVGLYASRADVEPSADAEPAAVKRIPVVVTRPEQRGFERILVTQGNIEAKHVALVSPRIPGTLLTISVDEGDAVIAGQTPLFQTDAVKLQQAVLIAEHDLAVARCAHRQAEANLEKVGADLHKGELDYKRFERLLTQEATTPDVFEQQQSRYRQLQAAHKLAQAQVDLVAEQGRQGQAALTIAQKDLSDTTVVAPISGVVSERFREPGEMGTPGKEVVRIEDTSVVEVSAFLPAPLYAAIQAGQSKIQVSIAGQDVGSQLISYKSPTVNPKLRTFEIKSLIADAPAFIVPGAMAEIAVVLEQRTGLGVPTEAVQQRSSQAVLFVIRDGQAVQQVVQTGLETDGWVELLAGELTEEDAVVTRGQFLLDDGSAVSVQKGEN